jgi:zinc ribbon protein
LGDKPTAAFVLSLIGGIFLLLGGVLAAVGFSFVFGGLGALVGIVGVIFGFIVILGAVMLYQKPQSHTMWGVVILILSIIAFPSLWGFGIGSLLAFIGAILALVYKPTMGPSGMPSQPMGSMPMGSMGAPMGQMGTTCKNCGANIPAGATRCPSCGASV